MQRLKTALSFILAASLILGGTIEAAGPSSRPGSSSKSSSTPSSRPSSRPNAPSVSKPSTPSSKPSSRPNTVTTPSSRPNAPSVSKPSTPSYKPSSRPETPSVTTPSTPSYKPSSRPETPSSSGFSFGDSKKPSSKPVNGFDSSAAQAKKREESKTVFQAATAPKDSYTTPLGKTVKVDTSKPSVSVIRDTVSSDEYASRPTRIEHHYHTHYGDRYNTYRSRPYIDVGGGYSPLFWYIMLDWSVQRQAQWMYHNQNTINQALYQEQLAKNAALRAEIDRLRASGTTINPGYVDPEFRDNPDLMYSDEYVTAVYNPTPVQQTYQSRPMTEEEKAAVAAFFKWVGIVLLVCVCGFGLYYLVFVKNW
jgi:hypothetical protein